MRGDMRNLGELDLNLLVVFKHLMQERSVAGAAKKLCVTPSAVSKALARLRDWFDDPLLVRVRQGLQPTQLSLTLEEELKAWLTRDPLKRVVLAFATALPRHGGAGALYVLLRKFKKSKGKVRFERDWPDFG